MALPAQLEATFLPEEIQFIVENEPIRIYPRVTTLSRDARGSQSAPKWDLMTTDVKPLKSLVAMRSVEVTLWVALLLKQQGQCSIVAPKWLSVKELDARIEQERREPGRFSNIPSNWLVIARILFDRASDDLYDPVHMLRSRVQDLRELRQTKALKGLQNLNESHLQLDNLSLLEINELRPFVVRTMDKLREIHGSALTENTVQQD